MSDIPTSPQSSTGSHSPRHHAPAPAASPRARWWTIFLGLVLLGAAGVALHDFLVLRDSIQGPAWLDPVFRWASDAAYGPWVLPAAIACGLVALILLIATLRPRARTHLAFGGSSELHARPVDVARIATATAQRVGGVFRASTVVTRKRITVTVNTAAGENTERDTVSAGVHAEVTRLAEMLCPAPAVVVKVSQISTGGDRR